MEYTPNTWLEIWYVIAWWLALQAFGWLVWPLVFRLFRWLPDRGFAFCKPFGLILVNYMLWILGVLGFLQNTWGNILLVLILAAILAVLLYRRQNEPEQSLRAWMRDHWRTVLAVELVFTATFVLWVLYKAYDPNIAITEKPMEFAFLNAIVRSERFPPYDPWMSGYIISYYYFGYIMIATLSKLAFVPTSFAFNLGMATLFALTASGAFGVVYNMVHVAARRRGTIKGVARTAIYYGVVAALLIPLAGNLEGVLEYAYANGVGVSVVQDGAGNKQTIVHPFWEWIDIHNLTEHGTVSDTWHPTSGWWWWRASRVINDKGLTGGHMEVISEFPAFSFLLGDMHPHVLAYPFVFMLVAMALNLLLSKRALPEVHWWLVYLCLGALGFLNTWDMPFYFFVLVVAYGLNRYLHPERHARSWLQRGLDRVPGLRRIATFEPTWLCQVIWRTVEMVLVSVILYLPYWLYSRPKAGTGILPNLFNVARFSQLFLMFGTFLVILTGLLVVLFVDLWRQGRVGWPSVQRQGVPIWLTALLFFPILLGLVLIPVMASKQMRTYIDDALENPQIQQFLGPQTLGSLLGTSLRIRLGLLPEQLKEIRMPAGPWTHLVLSLLIAGVVFWAVRTTFPQGFKSDPAAVDPPLAVLFAMLLAFTGLLLVFSVEFLYLRDAFGNRMNTVFKFYFQAWALLGIVAAFGIYYLLEGRGGSPVGRAIWGAICVLLLFGGLLYPLGMSISRTEGFAGPATLDGMAFVARYHPEEYAAIRWLNENAPGRPVIVEQVRGSFQYEYARISSRTGLPAVMGWTGHEEQWHGLYDEIREREADVGMLYSGGITDAKRVMEKYDVRYVVVGYLERNEYGATVTKFARFMDVAFQEGNTIIYQRR